MTGGKHSMKTIQWKRSAVVATVLLFVCAAVYLNWRYAGQTAETAKTAAKQTDQAQTDPASAREEDKNVKVLGQASLVGGVPTDAGGQGDALETAGTYFDTARLSRQQSRDNALALLREAAEQEGADQEAISEANLAIQTMAGYTMLEAQVENLVKAKGYLDCVAFMGDGGVSVVVSTSGDGLQTEDVAKITDIVLNETDYTAGQIKIMEAD